MSERTKITGMDTITFPSALDSALITTKEACKYVNTFFSRIFRDYAGCIIRIDQSIPREGDPQSQLNAQHPVQVDLYFNATPSDNSEGTFRAFKLAGEVDKKEDAVAPGMMNYTSKINSWNAAITENKVTCITQDAVDIMYDFLWYEVKKSIPEKTTAKEYNNRGISVETCINTNANPSYYNEPKTVYGVIRYIDINEVFKYIIGAEHNDSKVYYQTYPVRPIVPQMAGMMGNVGEQKWLLSLNRLNEVSMRNLLMEIGSGPAIGPNIETAKIAK